MVRLVSKVRVHVSVDELSLLTFFSSKLTASRSLRYTTTSEGGRTTYTVTDGIQHETALALERVRRMEHLAGSAAAAAIDQPAEASRPKSRTASGIAQHGEWHETGRSQMGRVRRCNSKGRAHDAAHCVLRVAARHIVLLWIRPGHTGVHDARIPR